MQYEKEILPADEDDGTMVSNVETIGEAVIGHRIVSVEHGVDVRPDPDPDKYYWNGNSGTVITLDNGTRVGLIATSDCCASTELESFLLHADRIDHIITGVGTTEGYTKWHIYADMGDVLELTVGWSCGNPFYYAYGFEIVVQEVQPE
jgi:hypothetical protein